MEQSTEAKKKFPPMMTTPEAAAYLAGRDMSERSRVNVSEFVRFTERFGLVPVDMVGGGSRNRGEVTVRCKWSKRQIDLILLTGKPLREALKWAQGATIQL